MQAVKRAEQLLKTVAAGNPGFQAEFKNGALTVVGKKTTLSRRDSWGEEGRRIYAAIKAMKPNELLEFKVPPGKNLAVLQKYCSGAGCRAFGPGRVMTSITKNKLVQVLLVN